MVGRKDYNGVPASDLENNSSQKKYTVNRGSSGGNISISKPACALFMMAALVLAAVAAVVAYFLAPNCDGYSLPQTLRKSDQSIEHDEPIVDYVRLPESIQPLHYRLHVYPKFEDFTTWGNVSIKLKINEKTDEILFNVLDLDVDKHSVWVRSTKDGKEVNVTSQKYDKEAETYSLHLEQSLSPKEEYEIFAEFTGKLNDYMVGFYRSHYVTGINVTRWLATTQFSPIEARRAFPCFDEPSLKATFSISVARPASMSSLSNMPLKNSFRAGDIVWDNYLQTPRMSTYLVAFIVHDFVSYQHDYNSSFTVWTTKDLLPHAEYAGGIGPQILDFYQDYFGIKFTIPKLDVITVPDFGFTAMENWGLITFKESALLFDRFSSTEDGKRSTALVLGHELAHSWFGNLVTPKWWNDVWMKEGFSTYYEYLATDKIHPDWNIRDEFFHDVTNSAFKKDSLISSRPIHLPIATANDVRQVFNPISYDKGASLVNMIANVLGDETFRRAMRKFLKTNEFSNTADTDLWDVLTDEFRSANLLDADATMKDVMTGWVRQAGYPVVTATADYENGIIKLSQKRFLLNGEGKKSNEKWWIPISYTTDLEKNFTDGRPKVWLKDGESSIDLKFSSWYLLNLKQGYYIVNYDERNWKMLSEIVMELPWVIRAQLVSDSMTLAKAGLIDYSIPLNMITLLGKRDTQLIFVSFLSIFEETDFLYSILYNTPAFGAYQKYFWKIFNLGLENISFEEGDNDTHIQKRIRELILRQACRQTNSKCTLLARRMYRVWMEHNHNINPNFRNVVYCTAIREGDEEEWVFAYKQYFKTNSVSEKGILLDALGCSTKHWMLAKYLEMTISNSSGIRKQDGSKAFAAVARNIYGYNLAFDFIRNRWDEINEYYGEGFGAVSKMVESLATYMNTPIHLRQLEDFRNRNKYNLKSTNRAFATTIEVVKNNVQWMQQNYESVETWLKQQKEYYGL